MANPVVRGNRFAISKSSSLSASRIAVISRSGGGASAAGLSPAGSAAADLGDQVDLALGLERGEVCVLEDLAVDRRRHPFLDLAAEAGEAAVELQNHAAEIVRFHLDLGQPAGEPAGCLAREMDARHI